MKFSEQQKAWQWLALGGALVSKGQTARVLALDSIVFDEAASLGLWQALQRDEASIKEAMWRIGLEAKDLPPFGAVLAGLAEDASFRRQSRLSDRVAMAAKVLSPDRLEEFLRRELAQLDRKDGGK